MRAKINLKKETWVEEGATLVEGEKRKGGKEERRGRRKDET